MDFVPNRLFAPWLYNRAVDAVAAISEGVADALARAGIARERITLVSSGVDCEQFAPATANQRAAAREAYGLGANEIAIGSIGALVERKGHRILIDALGRMAFEAAHLRCFIAGSGPLRPALEAQISDHQITAKVQLLGPLDDPRVLLNALDIFVMPSLAEGLGVAALEAMASGLPVVGSSVGGLQEAILDSETGLLLRPGDADAVADAISALMLNSSLRVSMGLAGRRRAVERFSMGGMVSKTLALYLSVLQRSASNRGKRRCEA
jgi:glycosyltransferase involved in cell wall biosynthesis